MFEVKLCSSQPSIWLEIVAFDVQQNHRIFDIINDSFPKRYEIELANRSFAPGASKAGETLQAFIEDRKRPKGRRRWNEFCEEG